MLSSRSSVFCRTRSGSAIADSIMETCVMNQLLLCSAEAFTSGAQAEPFVQDLLARQLTPATLDAWLADWTHLARLVQETHQRLYVATTVDTEDHASERRYCAFLEEVYPASQAAEQQLKQ